MAVRWREVRLRLLGSLCERRWQWPNTSTRSAGEATNVVHHPASLRGGRAVRITAVSGDPQSPT